MKLLDNHAVQNRNYCDKIIPSSYLQKASTSKTEVVYPTIIELLFSLYDHHFTMVEPVDKSLYIKQRVVEVATCLDEDKKQSYDKFSYNKNMSISIIQYGLQSMKSVSALLYLSDMYKITTHIYLRDTKVKVITSNKTRDILHIVYYRNKWTTIESPKGEYEGYKLSEFKDLSACLQMDVSTMDVYNRFLNPISKYKSADLVSLAGERGISIMRYDGKKKVKKDIYSSINLYELNKH